MALFRNIIITVLVCCILKDTLTVPLVFLNFNLQQGYIAKNLCVNRNKPSLHCNGHCYLNKQLKKATDQQKKNASSINEKNESPLFVEPVRQLTIAVSVIRISNYEAPANDAATFPSHALSILKPPEIPVCC
ncbi:MAG TPA: hypothetical protein VM802_09240 [Chitinophaga sp.]|uniref:hypothetical protein n=1 Tax=Chitinophaga sp. TaxID=1869181 RepID=UPI002D007A30|nr:hypothetical protein [Chitinophaga sp.]HVI45044.1 hypothetical protein [Chitinophaga sp.]